MEAIRNHINNMRKFFSRLFRAPPDDTRPLLKEFEREEETKWRTALDQDKSLSWEEVREKSSIENETYKD